MRGTGALLSAKYKLKQIYPFKGSWGKVATSTPKKQVNVDATGRSVNHKGEGRAYCSFWQATASSTSAWAIGRSVIAGNMVEL
ncbi:hypothetical protein OWV82_014339 [Melia azedarach]|uniref:Uncharacterized protein n=1 Tax=Melia azedarach TaxID=155640 RepID=A0ACC1XM70_MELAZ|nr:hypothetical protein OWV82_014339 [Melia azedarach]